MAKPMREFIAMQVPGKGWGVGIRTGNRQQRRAGTHADKILAKLGSGFTSHQAAIIAENLTKEANYKKRLRSAMVGGYKPTSNEIIRKRKRRKNPSGVANKRQTVTVTEAFSSHRLSRKGAADAIKKLRAAGYEVKRTPVAYGEKWHAGGSYHVAGKRRKNPSGVRLVIVKGKETLHYDGHDKFTKTGPAHRFPSVDAARVVAKRLAKKFAMLRGWKFYART